MVKQGDINGPVGRLIAMPAKKGFGRYAKSKIKKGCKTLPAKRSACIIILVHIYNFNKRLKHEL